MAFKPKQLLTALLLAFVGACLVALAVKGLGGRAAPPAAPGGAAAEPPAAGRRLIVYYFHGTVRCATCRLVEEYTREAVTNAFSEALAAGKLEWQPVNVDEPQHTHFVDDYGLVSRAVVIAETDAGRPVRWKNLDDVWRLANDRPRFLLYVRSEIAAFMQGAS